MDGLKLTMDNLRNIFQKWEYSESKFRIDFETPPMPCGNQPFHISAGDGGGSGGGCSPAGSVRAKSGSLSKKGSKDTKPPQDSLIINIKRPFSFNHLPQRPPVCIQFTKLSYCISQECNSGQKSLLKSISGKFQSGELTAIMGPSGAGKSTLMNVLAGYRTSGVTGSILINGRDRNSRRFRKLSCYIMQDDQLLPHLTVWESMNVSANLKLGRNMAKKEKRIVIEEILETLGLMDCSNTRTSNLSGGQRKRLSIALELVNNPPVMFFDEPTSGLDSSSCFQCLSLLKCLARGGRTIICTIHQPSARLFEMFDHLYMLADGQCIYQGDISGLVPYLANLSLECPSYHNPADYVMEVACGEHGDVHDKLVLAVTNGKTALFNSHEKSTKEIVANGDANYNNKNAVSCTSALLHSDESLSTLGAGAGFPTSSFKQFVVLINRTFLSIIRDQMLTRMRLVSHLCIGLLIGLIYYDIGDEASKAMNNAGCIFFTVLFLMFTAMMPTVLTFPLEMSVFLREHLNYWYSLKSFYLAKTMADLPFQIVFSTVYVVIVYFMTKQPMEPERFFMVLLMCVLVSLVAQSLGLLIGAGMEIETGTFLGPVTSIPVLLFSGFFVNFSTIPWYLQWVTYVSYIRYGFEGCMIAIYGGNRPKLHCSEAYCHYRSPSKFLEAMDMKGAVFWIDVVALVGFFVLLRVCAYFALKLKLKLNT
ncbi:hypothetical protein GE061_014355 [Apolygus lucorum]|uniref:ABC transporter domain-containing protein n=1 Tax=Apolygus lucorum TaxID=248454 RepID=A0A8S9XRP2_APOLU|nr:hypothetical protein GE061_014355 [Apolygus lucorum]